MLVEFGSEFLDWSKHKPSSTCINHLLEKQRVKNLVPDLDGLVALVKTVAMGDVVKAQRKTEQ